MKNRIYSLLLLCLLLQIDSSIAQTNSLIWKGAFHNYDNGRTGLSLAQPPAFSPDGKNVYVGSYDGFAWFSFNEDESKLTWEGTLIDGGNGGEGVSDGHAVIVSPDGKFIYLAAGYQEHSVTVYERKAGTGEPVYKAIYRDGANGISTMKYPYGCTMDKNGDHLYIVSKDWDGNSVVWFQRNKETGLLTFGGKLVDNTDGVDGLLGAAQICLSKDELHAYVASFGENSLSYYDRNPTTGALIYKGNLKDGENGVDGLEKVYWVAAHPNGKYLYTGAQDESAVAWFELDNTGKPIYKGKIQDGTILSGARGLSIHPNGDWLIASASWADCLTWFEINQETGQIAIKGHVKNGESGVDGIDGSRYLSFSPNGKHLVATGYDGNSVAWFVWDGKSSGLERLRSAPNFELLGKTVHSKAGQYKIRLTDLFGKTIFSAESENNEVKLPSDIHGLFILTIITKDGFFSKRLLLENE